MTTRNIIHILQLSDLHLGVLDDKRKHALVNDRGENELADIVTKELKKVFSLPIDFLVVCGDYVWKGSNKNDHRKAADVLYDL